jgi:hypothetical protein
MGLNPIADSIITVLELFRFDEGLVYRRQISERWFAPVANPKDQVVKMIVRSNIGGMITKKAPTTDFVQFGSEEFPDWSQYLRLPAM